METLAIAHRPAAQEEDTSAAAGHSGNNSEETSPTFPACLRHLGLHRTSLSGGVMTHHIREKAFFSSCTTGRGEDQAPVKMEPSGNKQSLLKQRDAGDGKKKTKRVTGL